MTHRLLTSGILICGVTIAGCYDGSKTSDDQATADEPAQEVFMDPEIAALKAMFAEREASALAEPYRGVETSNGIQTGLFPITSTGIETKPIVDGANKLLAQFDAESASAMQFDIQDQEWRKWSNVDNGIYDRQGISLKAMTKAQREAAFALMKSSLSAKGLTQSRDIMKTDQTLSELNNNAPHLDEQLYFFTIMGIPSLTEPWGWQVDGHHLVINYFVLGDQVVMSPVFMGGEPVHTKLGKYSGNTVMQPEQNIGLELMQSFNIDQQQRAIISSTKSHNDNRAAANKDNITLNYEGLQASDMTNLQRTKLLELTKLYIGNLQDDHATIKMEDIKAHLGETWFAWIGDTSDEAVFYYRIHSPVVLIEFDHQGPIGIPNSGPRDVATRNHIHTVVRTPNGNDYGKDLLRQHLEDVH